MSEPRTALANGTIAYFSMDVAIDSDIPTYSGGLGILAGDMLRSAADLGLPMVAVTLLHRKGYFDQRLDARGNQLESPSKWSPENRLEPLPQRVSIGIEGRNVSVRPWRYLFRGITGHAVPLLLLDTDLVDNDPRDRVFTDHLYGGDEHYRLCQETILGFGGLAVLRALGYTNVHVFHMNEGHSAFITVALLEERIGAHLKQSVSETEIKAVRQHCVFTTHTPVPAGHDRFHADLIRQVLGERCLKILGQLGVMNGDLNMTELALRLSRYANGVSLRHGQVSRGMFPEYNIDAITNGVHAGAWASAPFCALYDRVIPEWRRDNCYLRYAIGISLHEVRQAHAQAKKELLQQVRWLTGVQLDESIFTLGFARRATGYKRADLILSDLDRLRQIAKDAGHFQIIYAGKAHPNDAGGKDIIRRIYKAKKALRKNVPTVFLDDYNLDLGGKMTSGVDLWLNTPQFPLEASGTSGMKAALNGVPSLSILDGWWVEGHIEGVTGWSIGEPRRGSSNGSETDNQAEAESLYAKLESVILPLYYRERHKFLEVMQHAIAINGSFFNTQRMVQQYITDAYLR